MTQQTTATRPILKKQTRRLKSGWLAIAGLLLLSALPVLGGVVSLSERSSDAASASSLASPLPMIAHIVAMSLFCLLGAFQFSPTLRVRRGWHRAAGRVLIPAGFIAALSSVWLAVFFGGPADESSLAMVRLVFAVAMTAFLVLGAIAITHRDFSAHGAWMTRAYAIAVSGGTQALFYALWFALSGEVDASGETLLIAAAFVVNSVVAELVILRRGRWARASAVAR